MTRPAPSDERGFVLGLVVLMLFAIAVAGAAGFQLVSTEFTLATQGRDGQKALVVARGGLSRFMGEQIGSVGDSVSYAIGEGVATVTTRKVFEQDSLNHLYYVRSVGSVSDLRTPADPAVRTVGTYAWHRISPVPHKGTLFLTDQRFRSLAGNAVSGVDLATLSECSGGATLGVPGVATGGTAQMLSGVIVGYPLPTDESYTGFANVVDSMRIRWDILTDPAFPLEFDDTAPDNWNAMPPDSFPLIRARGDLTAYGWDPRSGGRGVLVVTGTFTPHYGFEWDGMILAGRLNAPAWWAVYDQPEIRGMILAGMSGVQQNEDFQSGLFQYHSCNVYRANRALSYLEVVDNALFEVAGSG
ncbi:MAG: hypothetical protein RJQ04_00310 [Longimicrobiales bacterium]